MHEDGDLARPLTNDEECLLKQAWLAAFGESYTQGNHRAGWQTWDYIIRSLDVGAGDYLPWEEILHDMPKVPVPDKLGQEYGLIWIHNGSGQPGAAIVGLTVAGMYRLAESLPDVRPAADMFASLIAAAARDAVNLAAVRDGVAAQTLHYSALPRFLNWFGQPSTESKYVIPPVAVSTVLKHEFISLSVIDVAADFTIGFWFPQARQFAQLDNAAAYVAHIVDASERAAARTQSVSSPLAAVQSIDYLAYVLREHPKWSESHIFVRAPDIQSALWLCQVVSLPG